MRGWRSSAGSSVAAQAEADHLSDRFHGYPPGLSTCLRHTDEVLGARIIAAASAGWTPVDLLAIPAHRRAQAIEDDLDAWSAIRDGGPCSWCGSAARRFGRGLHRAEGMNLRALPAPPPFAPVPGSQPPTTACGWCYSVLSESGSDGWRALVYRAVAGVQTMMDGWNLTGVVPNAEEAGTTVVGGLPLAYLTPALRNAIRLDALANVPRSSWVTTSGKADDVSIPGLASPVHTEATLPPRPPVRHLPLSQRDRAIAEQNRKAVARLKADREAAERENARHCEQPRRRRSSSVRCTNSSRLASSAARWPHRTAWSLRTD